MYFLIFFSEDFSIYTVGPCTQDSYTPSASKMGPTVIDKSQPIESIGSSPYF